MFTLSKLEKLTKDVHSRCLKFAFHKSVKNTDFYKNDDLACMCSVASFYFMYRLAHHSDLNIKKVCFVEGNFDDSGREHTYINHAWITYENTIVDLTLQQFVSDIANPFIIDRKNRLFKYFLPIKSFGFDEMNKLKRSLREWGKEQSPLVWHPQKIDKLIDN